MLRARRFRCSGSRGRRSGEVLAREQVRWADMRVYPCDYFNEVEIGCDAEDIVHADG